MEFIMMRDIMINTLTNMIDTTTNITSTLINVESTLKMINMIDIMTSITMSTMISTLIHTIWINTTMIRMFILQALTLVIQEGTTKIMLINKYIQLKK